MSIHFISVAAFLIAAGVMPGILYIAKKFSLYDTIDNRKVHTGNIPRLGGAAILLGFCISLVLLICRGVFHDTEQHIWTLIPALLCIMIMGFIDDIVTMRARIKLYTQILAVAFVLAGKFTFSGIYFGPAHISIDFGFAKYAVTALWILGVTNAVNFIDGIDGLCGSLSVIVCLTYAYFFHNCGNPAGMYICFSLAAAICGFLVYNLPLPKAKIFMGDGGSQSIGFALAILPLLKIQETKTSIPLPFTALILMIPLFDAVAAIWRRIREHRRIDSPDKYHLHHKLLMLGFSERKTLCILLFFQLIISLFAVIILQIEGMLSLTLYISVVLMGIFFFSVIHIAKVRIIQNPENQ
ncbi:MAG: undecaprenyl/decaprenyl-phosphate alpha-N-acetylglucosaminyl 1-phosphate transferase [Bacteroides sp.]|nr:undecaprenyl/decaprenyl-phosphate alpha-N-acetylglucosaminyl 1-phosphate transferase [Prevotella sp.]MCM1407277.1 undecaprenyl/decaprenyl-phosphate alpha-N-acetylglucosaminyl 1-phosphate transferase [Treponema brennaborense]MCM1469765.1 undecaprenyl/decaprenyl-phosphate alpha-N-acetylglucosaminyl 1-phosphate transferase [Bacteroides sp.]